MTSLSRLFVPVIGVLVLMPGGTGAESARVVGHGGSASASLDFRIVVPPTLQVLENSHPPRIEPDASGAWMAPQRLVVFSNMKNGFCAQLSLTDSPVQGWRLNTVDDGGMTMQPPQAPHQGWRLCGTRPGRYTLQLQHRFEAQGTALAWPVLTELSAL